MSIGSLALGVLIGVGANVVSGNIMGLSVRENGDKVNLVEYCVMGLLLGMVPTAGIEHSKFAFQLLNPKFFANHSKMVLVASIILHLVTPLLYGLLLLYKVAPKPLVKLHEAGCNFFQPYIKP